MTLASTHPLKTGGDPRLLAEFAALKDEMQKLTHPARPDVDWPHAARLCLQLFEQNGVELQTAVWYTLARAQLAGASGMMEGLAVIGALLSHEWGTFWPQQVHARVELLASLSRRLQQFLRTQTLTQAELATLSRSAQLLDEMGEVLQRLELRQHSQLDALRDRIRSAIVMLERSDAPSPTALIADNQLAAILPSSVKAEITGDSWIYVPQSDAPIIDVRKLRRTAFLWGIGATLAIGTLISATSYYINREPLQEQLLASLAPAPALLDAETLVALKTQRPKLLADETALLQQTQQQLDRLAAASPAWSLQQGSALVQQMRALLPNAADAQIMESRWQQQLTAMALPPGTNQGWHQGMQQLQSLSHRLEELDEKRGKYLTVSELKTAVYNLQKSFNASIPLEELLRQLAAQEPPLTPAQAAQTEMQLKQLTAEYVLITTPQDKTVLKPVNSAAK